jgi:hypothetical protein
MHIQSSAVNTNYFVCQVCLVDDAQFMRYQCMLSHDTFKSDPIGDWLAELVVRRLRWFAANNINLKQQ